VSTFSFCHLMFYTSNCTRDNYIQCCSKLPPNSSAFNPNQHSFADWPIQTSKKLPVRQLEWLTSLNFLCYSVLHNILKCIILVFFQALGVGIALQHCMLCIKQERVSDGLRCHVDWLVEANTLEKYAVSIFRVWLKGTSSELLLPWKP
jgi:hypothetical protein